jgi:hypothetical protein
VNFNTDKDQLVARYRLGTEQALEQADFLNNPDIIVLQALTIYLGVLQHTGETRSAWLLAGVLVRVAVSMKLHRDGSDFPNITPFEIETRRRLWWQICLIDSRSEDMQVSKYKLSEGMFDTEIPANTDDANLGPGMSKPPVVAERWTDMTVFLIHCEVWKLSRRLQSVTAASHASPPDIDERLELFQRSQTRIEDTYLKHLNPNQPLHSFVATIARLFLTKVDLILHTKQHSLLTPHRAIKYSCRRCQSSNTPTPYRTNPVGAAGAGKYKAGSHRGMLFASCSASYARAVGDQSASGHGRQLKDLSIVSLRRLGEILGTSDFRCWPVRCKETERVSFITKLPERRRMHTLI